MANVIPISRRRRSRSLRRLEPLIIGVVVAAVVLIVKPALAPMETANAAPPPAPTVRAEASSDGFDLSARVVDGDGLWIAGTEIRLHGVDAFELRQSCGAVRCGADARRSLTALVTGHDVRCRAIGTDRYGRTVALCEADGEDLGEAQVRLGHALAYRRYSTAYVDDEAYARAARAGAWRGEVTAPSDWRRASRG